MNDLSAARRGLCVPSNTRSTFYFFAGQAESIQRIVDMTHYRSPSKACADAIQNFGWFLVAHANKRDRGVLRADGSRVHFSFTRYASPIEDIPVVQTKEVLLSKTDYERLQMIGAVLDVSEDMALAMALRLYTAQMMQKKMFKISDGAICTL